MGVHGLWPIVNPASEIIVLQELAIIEGLQRKKRSFRVGVDAYAIMAQCIAGAQSKGMHGPGPLRVLYYKLCGFLKSPIIWVFVFDGPLRPKEKHGRKVIALPPSWRGPVKLLLKAFGFIIHEAPGEGEAELAKLNELGIIDAVLTTDSDALIFGAQYVIRSIPRSDRRKWDLHSDEMVTYSAESISHTRGVELTAGGLLLVALILKGDYFDGVEGLGTSMALGLGRSGLGDRLLNAAKTLSDDRFEIFRRNWLEDLKNELKFNLQGDLPSRKPTAIKNIPDSFPPKKVLDLYVNPLTSFSASQNPPNFLEWPDLGPPQISDIASFCQSHLGWNDEMEMLRTFQKNLWEGIFLRLLYTRDIVFNPNDNTIHASSLSVEVVESVEQPRQVKRALHIHRWNRVTFSTVALVTETGMSVPSDAVCKKSCIVWVPRLVIPEAMANMQKKKLVKDSQHAEIQREGDDTKFSPSSNTASESEDEEIIDLTTPPPLTCCKKQRKRLKLSMPKDTSGVKEVIDLTTPPPRNHAYREKWRQGPGIVDLTRPIAPPTQSPDSLPYKPTRTTIEPTQRSSRVLDALDGLEWEIRQFSKNAVKSPAGEDAEVINITDSD